MDLLTQRQQRVLTALVEAHIESAQPIGSRWLAEYAGMDCSPATLRHEMGELEEKGYLVHTHISSGRVPTDTGYRFYVESSLLPDTEANEFDPRDPELLRSGAIRDLDLFSEEISRWLSTLTSEASAVVFHDPDVVLPTGGASKCLVRGFYRLLEKPEFRDPQKAKPLLEAFDEKEELARWIQGIAREGEVVVRIGRENRLSALWDCSVVTSEYSPGGRQAGAIAIIGPRRMHYRRVISFMQGMIRYLENHFMQDPGGAGS